MATACKTFRSLDISDFLRPWPLVAEPDATTYHIKIQCVCCVEIKDKGTSLLNTYTCVCYLIALAGDSNCTSLLRFHWHGCFPGVGRYQLEVKSFLPRETRNSLILISICYCLAVFYVSVC